MQIYSRPTEIAPGRPLGTRHPPPHHPLPPPGWLLTDGFLYIGTAAALSGQRYCIDAPGGDYRGCDGAFGGPSAPSDFFCERVESQPDRVRFAPGLISPWIPVHGHQLGIVHTDFIIFFFIVFADFFQSRNANC